MRFRFSIRAIMIMTALVALTMCGICWIGRVDDTELSLDSFRLRYISYHEIPFTNVQISSRRQVVVETALSKFLLSHDVVSPYGREKWSLQYRTRYRSFLASYSYGPSGRLRDEILEQGHLGDWAQWSRENVTMASALWPRMSTIAREIDPSTARYYLRDLRIKFGILDGEINSWNEFQKAISEIESGLASHTPLPSKLEPVRSKELTER